MLPVGQPRRAGGRSINHGALLPTPIAGAVRRRQWAPAAAAAGAAALAGRRRGPDVTPGPDATPRGDMLPRRDLLPCQDLLPRQDLTWRWDLLPRWDLAAPGPGTADASVGSIGSSGVSYLAPHLCVPFFVLPFPDYRAVSIQIDFLLLQIATQYTLSIHFSV